MVETVVVAAPNAVTSKMVRSVIRSASMSMSVKFVESVVVERIQFHAHLLLLLLYCSKILCVRGGYSEFLYGLYSVIYIKYFFNQ